MQTLSVTYVAIVPLEVSSLGRDVDIDSVLQLEVLPNTGTPAPGFIHEHTETMLLIGRSKLLILPRTIIFSLLFVLHDEFRSPP